VDLPVPLDLPPMEATSVPNLPRGPGWQYEPKWDGFRCLAFRDRRELHLMSKAGQPLGRYFPEVVEALRGLGARRFALDGELVVLGPSGPDFDALLQRIHPAESRIRRLAAETPAAFCAFDLLADARGHSLLALPLARRRQALEAFAARHFPPGGRVRLSPATTDPAGVDAWMREVGGALDGIVAKRLDRPYGAGGREAMVKAKALRTADCVVGGFRYGSGTRQVGSLLLGLYGEDGLLHHVGFCSAIRAAERPALTRRLEALAQPPGFTGRAPGGPSRWSTERSAEWQPLRPELVVEVRFDHVTNGRFRHGTRLVRWRPDKHPRQCTMEQLRQRAAVPGLWA
jgi:ATP-dependent DNA ligase